MSGSTHTHYLRSDLTWVVLNIIVVIIFDETVATENTEVNIMNTRVYSLHVCLQVYQTRKNDFLNLMPLPSTPTHPDN